MRTRRLCVRVVSFGGLAGGAALAATVARGEPAPAPGLPGPVGASSVAAAPGLANDPQLSAHRPILPPSREYAALCAQGNAKYGAHDFPGAIERYQKAIARMVSQPLGYYLLGEAQLAEGNAPEAKVAESRAADEAGERDPALHARALFVLADIEERQKNWADARARWQTYLDWVRRFPGANGAPASAQSRIEAIDAMQKQDAAYEGVRLRIAETKDGGVFTDPTQSPPPPLKKSGLP